MRWWIGPGNVIEEGPPPFALYKLPLVSVVLMWTIDLGGHGRFERRLVVGAGWPEAEIFAERCRRKRVRARR